MIRTFGLGPRAKKCLFWRLGQDLRRKSSANPRGSVKNNALGKMTIFGPFSGLWIAIIAPKTESVC